MHCPTCRRENDPEHRFCIFCGSPLRETACSGLHGSLFRAQDAETTGRRIVRLHRRTVIRSDIGLWALEVVYREITLRVRRSKRLGTKGGREDRSGTAREEINEVQKVLRK